MNRVELLKIIIIIFLHSMLGIREYFTF